MPNKSDPMAARGVSNKEVGEFTKQYVSRNNKPLGYNERRVSGEDRGTYVNHDMQAEGCGEYDVYLMPKMSDN